MHVLLIYDVDKTRVNKVRKIVHCYMRPVQESVFEIKMSKGKYEEMIGKLKAVLKEKDSLVCYFLDRLPFGSRECFGAVREEVNPLL